MGYELALSGFYSLFSTDRYRRDDFGLQSCIAWILFARDERKNQPCTLGVVAWNGRGSRSDEVSE